MTWGPHQLPVPHAAAWSAERTAVAGALTVRADGAGLAYRDERPGDRDGQGVLWARIGQAQGQGRPNFRALHSGRQRGAMLDKLCQVCGGQASRTGRGWLFLLQRPAPPEARDWPEGLLCTKPPVCRPCAALAMRHCPHLSDPVVVRSRKPRTWGVFGGFFTPAPDGGLAPHADSALPYGDARAPWFLASQLVVELTRCTVESAPRPAR
ncbi:hypothetical protein [Streptomyces marincola]|uniref:Uncharacterized protein n=1 Tax=Streptomyces marincola TaxID=2878388 RepID=A0A1W7CYL8_9ACTN|nr:hypothetical protein [Streptomyces marincola]ARQ69862.1 hypothetical protein CAG99_14190 [Streptomyces marincola]